MQIYVLAGEGRATVSDEMVVLTAGDLLVIEAGETHEIKATGSESLETLNLYMPPEY